MMRAYTQKGAFSMSESIKSVPLSELPEGDARRALAAELAAGRASVYQQLITHRTIIWLDHGPYAEQRLAFCRMARLQPEQRLFVDEWLALYTACQNADQHAENASGDAA
jgi:hypothetical protein